jgi:glycosyltransferase involved in cell wall biosynthesis
MPEKINTIYITFNGITDPLGQSQVLPYLEDLSKNNIKFYLISLEKNLKKAKELSDDIEKLSISWYRLKYFKFHFLGMIINVIQCSLLSFYLLAVKKIKIVHARSYTPIFSVFLFKKIFNFKLIFDMRGFWPEELADSGRIKYNSIYYKILKFLERKSILASDYIVMLTPESKAIIEGAYAGKKVAWMPTCVDKNRFKNEEKISIEDKFVMVYSGSLWTFYDMPAMVDFFKVLKSKIANAHFLILGNNDSHKLHTVFLEKGIDKKDYTVMTVKSKDVPKYLSGSDLGISFIYDYYSKKAAFPTKLAEYFMSGLPVVANAQSKFIKELVEYNKVGVILEKFNDEYYQKAAKDLMLLLKDKDLKNRCTQVAEKYLDKNVCINKYLDIYRELV